MNGVGRAGHRAGFNRFVRAGVRLALALIFFPARPAAGAPAGGRLAQAR